MSSPRITVERFHDLSFGHRVVGHEGKCRNLHGHNYRVHFVCSAQELDDVGRIIDFGIIKSILCEWLEDKFDHRMVLWSDDPAVDLLRAADPDGLVLVSYNPTAENLAIDFLTTANLLLLGSGVHCVEVRVEETRKCSATATYRG